MRKCKTILYSLCAIAPLRLRVKKPLLIFAFVVLFSFGAFAQNGSDAANDIRILPVDFKSDGCSLFPDGNYCDCCIKHDEAYYFGGTEKERRRADVKLYKCVRAKKGFYNKLIAPLIFIGVRIGGTAWLPTPFRWGFGKSRKRIKETKNNSPAKKPKEKPGKRS